MNVLDLKSKEIFKAIKINHTRDGKLDNLIAISNDVIFVWDNENGCLLTQGTRSVCTNYQKLRPTQRPEFRVRNVTVNESGTRAVLWGGEGVFVMDLPWRCGPKLEFQDGKSDIIAVSWAIDQLDLSYDVQVVQVRWHPSFAYDSSLIILLSDNSVCHFDVMAHARVATFRVGSRPNSRQKTLAALGETAVDFCFPPIIVETNNEQTDCTLLILHGNGDVLLVSGGDYEGQVLPISPLPFDNCLNDTCAILCLPDKPPRVVIATASGVVYHTLLVPLDVDEIDVAPRLRKYRLLVVESVAIDAGLLSNSDDMNSFPLRLSHDLNHKRRYFIIHAFGVYSVMLNAGRVDLNMEDEFSTKQPSSVIEHLVSSGTTLLGAIAIAYGLVTLDLETNVSIVPLRRFDLPPIELFTPNDDSPNKMLLSDKLHQPYVEQVERLLQESHVLPLLALPKNKISNEQFLALFVRIGDAIRQVVIPRYTQVRNILDQRIKLINTMKELQLNDIKRLETSRAEIQLAAEEWAERVQTVSDLLDDYKGRTQRIVSQVAEAHPGLTMAETQLQNTVDDIEGKLNHYEKGIDKLKKNSAYQESKIAAEEEADAATAMSSKQVETLRECLSVVGDNVSALVRQVHHIKEMIGANND